MTDVDFRCTCTITLIDSTPQSVALAIERPQQQASYLHLAIMDTDENALVRFLQDHACSVRQM